MYKDEFGQIIFDENDICNLLLQDHSRILKKVLVDSNIEFDESLGIKNIPNLVIYKHSDCDVEHFDNVNQSTWYMPDEYKTFDIAKYVLDQCKNDEELQRAGHELLLFQERSMFPLLQYLKYLVDTMRANNIVWGVGRGSSVSSFVLYLIGIHKINSLYYDLSIDEFIK
jgi:DNA polymerase III alpha subunit